MKYLTSLTLHLNLLLPLYLNEKWSAQFIASCCKATQELTYSSDHHACCGEASFWPGTWCNCFVNTFDPRETWHEYLTADIGGISAVQRITSSMTWDRQSARLCPAFLQRGHHICFLISWHVRNWSIINLDILFSSWLVSGEEEVVVVVQGNPWWELMMAMFAHKTTRQPRQQDKQVID